LTPGGNSFNMIYMRVKQTVCWTAHSAFRTAQNWLDCTVRICPVMRAYFTISACFD